MTEPSSNGAGGEQQPAAAIDLDALDREGGTPPPFDFVLDGKRYFLTDPKGLDWQDVTLAASDPFMFMRLALPPEDHQTFFRAKLPVWKMDQLMSAYQKHYGLPSLGDSGGLRR